jgi:hypothetical protein
VSDLLKNNFKSILFALGSDSSLQVTEEAKQSMCPVMCALRFHIKEADAPKDSNCNIWPLEMVSVMALLHCPRRFSIYYLFVSSFLNIIVVVVVPYA